MSYIDLSTEDRIIQAINFVACDHPLPPVLETWLRAEGLYELIVNPGGAYEAVGTEQPGDVATLVG